MRRSVIELLPFSMVTFSMAAFSPQEPMLAPERGLVLNGTGAFQGYTLFPPLRATTTYFLDMEGAVVHTWESQYRPGNSAYLLNDGTLLRTGRRQNELFEGGGQGGQIQLLAWDGTVLWDFEYSNDERMSHHDIEPLPNGNVLVIAWEHVSAADALAAGRDPGRLGAKGFWPDCVVEIEPVLPGGGKVVWEWHAFEHLIQDFDATKAHHGDVTAHPERIDVNGDHRALPPMSEAERTRQEELAREMRALGYAGDDEEPPRDERGGERREDERLPGDWLHTNGIDYHPELDLIVLSVRRFHEIWILDHSTTTAEAAGSTGGRWGRGGDLLYRWGNPRTYGQGSQADQRLFGQHDASFVAGSTPGVPHVLVFNNGEGRPGGNFSSVDELALPLDPEGHFEVPEGAFAPKEPLWSYTAPLKESFFSSFIGGAQRLTNGNTLICSGVQGRFFEVTRDGRIVWDYLNPFGEVEVEREPPGGARGGGAGGGPGPHGLFRGTRIAPDHPGLAGKDLSVGSRPRTSLEPRPVRVAEIEGIAPLHVVGGLHLGGQPTLAAFEELAAQGTTLVIDLRQKGELTAFDEPLLVEELGMEYVRLGFRKPEELTDGMLDEARRLLRERGDELVLLHCASSNRVGAVWLAARVLDEEVPWETALAEAHEVGLGSAGYEARILAYVRGPAAERWAALKQEIRAKFPGVEQMGVAELSARLALEGKQPLLLDARAEEEYAVSHLHGARRAESKADALAELKGVPRDREIVLYCSVGYRSSALAAQLKEEGFTNAKNLEGSIFEWANAGHPVYRGAERVRTVHRYDDDWGQLLRRELWP